MSLPQQQSGLHIVLPAQRQPRHLAPPSLQEQSTVGILPPPIVRDGECARIEMVISLPLLAPKQPSAESSNCGPERCEYVEDIHVIGGLSGS